MCQFYQLKLLERYIFKTFFFLCARRRTRRRHAHGKQVYSVLCPSIDVCIAHNTRDVNRLLRTHNIFTISLSLVFRLTANKCLSLRMEDIIWFANLFLTNFCSFYLLQLHFYYYIIGFYVFQNMITAKYHRDLIEHCVLK